jgi:uncharacterized membrane protein YeiH
VLVPPINTTSFFSLIDVAGVLAGAMAGALAARRNQAYHFDFVGVLGLGFITALGGGITRDIILQHGPPLAFTDPRYLTLALIGAVLGLVWGAFSSRRLDPLLIVVDAAALGFFAVAGATRAEAAGFAFLPSVLIGITTAVGGGALGDVFSGRSPKVFERGEPYALVAAIVAVLFVLCHRYTGNARWSTLLAMGVGFILRMAALRFRWRTRAVREHL